MALTASHNCAPPQGPLSLSFCYLDLAKMSLFSTELGNEAVKKKSLIFEKQQKQQ